MVLLAASIVTRTGRAVVSRQFVDMTRARIEGLLAAFPKLIPKDGGQHTFVETDSVRYVYQPIEKLYMVLITTKSSNILEDLETLRLFARVIPEYCRNQDEADISDHAFELIFAFDEVVALGYRENVNLAQIRNFTEMDSHDERVAIAVREEKEKEAKRRMLEEAKKLSKERRDKAKGNGGGASSFGANFGSNFGGVSSSNSGGGSTPAAEPVQVPKPTSKPMKSGKGMKLGNKNKEDKFLQSLGQEGVSVMKKKPVVSGKTDSKAASSAVQQATKTPEMNQEAVHIRLEEKITAIMGRDGDVEKFSCAGFVYLHVNDESSTRVKLLFDNNVTNGAQMQTHPNIDKKNFQANNIVALKNPEKPFPVGQDVGVLKWRLQNNDEDMLPLKIVCWPNDTGSGSCDVNVEYELQAENLELSDVKIIIPVPSGCGAPNVNDCDGSYEHDARKNILVWNLPVIDSSNGTGQMDFSMASNEDDFFPVNVEFHSTKTLFTDISVNSVSFVEDDTPAKYSSETALLVEKYTIGEE